MSKSLTAFQPTVSHPQVEVGLFVSIPQYERINIMSPKSLVTKFMYSLLSPKIHKVREGESSPRTSSIKRMSSTGSRSSSSPPSDPRLSTPSMAAWSVAWHLPSSGPLSIARKRINPVATGSVPQMAIPFTKWIWMPEHASARTARKGIPASTASLLITSNKPTRSIP